MKHKFKNGEMVKCIATKEQLRNIGIMSSAPNFLNKEIYVQQEGTWSKDDINKKISRKPAYKSLGMSLPEPYLKALKPERKKKKKK